MIRSYLEYLETNLGVSGAMISPEVFASAHSNSDLDSDRLEKLVDDSLRISTKSSEMAIDEWMPASFETTYKAGAQYHLIFLRVNDYRRSLSEDFMAAELLGKLRSAIGFDADKAPWVETSLGNWQVANLALSKQAPRVLLMLDDQLVKSESNDGVGVIPDPAELVSNVALKRPTWEYLKDWK